MNKLMDAAAGIAAKAKQTADHLVKDAAKAAKEASNSANEKKIIKQAEKKRSASKNTALLALSDIAKDLESYNKNLTPSDTVKAATEVVISEIEKLKEMISQMTPETLVPILEEQKEKWLDEKNVTVEGDNYAQQELDKSEIYKRRKMAAKKCEKAIEALRKQAEEENKE